jgi:uncharacterized ubiquitin-like protein YukD
MLAIEFNIKWNKRELSLSLEGEQTVGELKERIRDETAVDPKRQKLLGLKKKDKQVVSDDVKLCDLAVKPGQKLILMGYGRTAALPPSYACFVLSATLSLKLVCRGGTMSALCQREFCTVAAGVSCVASAS